ncbi:acetyl-CoA carboxylase biotin carboxylase subunit, partial [bacterium]|nr:acetyl-CoA carboxylase biotin carboxylase subunit [bacterium]
MFSKILIANRGEIAIRIMRACREMGIRTVSVFSDPDKFAPHMTFSDEAYALGGVTSAESYLDMDKIINIAKKSKADAVHPGYGFLAENSDFRRDCDDAGIVFIGPSAYSMEIMGDKIKARQLMIKAEVPVVPGTSELVKDEKELADRAKEVGFPVMLKAVAGGGGKGMRIVKNQDELLSSFKMAQSEAKSAFGDNSVYIEKYLKNPRHIEFQILADSHGNYIHLGERECSIQRRHQKVIEETPSPVIDKKLRKKMGEKAIACAKASGYFNAGTIEFLFDYSGNFYFLEMNTRLQVEHPVTELVTGIDIVKQQIKIAAGEKLEITQDDVKPRGASIECRIYAEDPDNNFFPSPGIITYLKEPSGPGIRNDSGIFEGSGISIYYDPLISKLCVWGKDRFEAIERMKRALSEY